MKIEKWGQSFPVSKEIFWIYSTDPRYRRKVSGYVWIDPTPAELAEYERGVALLEELRENRFYNEGGPDYGSEMDKPVSLRKTEYAETHEEWMTRCERMDQGLE